MASNEKVGIAEIISAMHVKHPDLTKRNIKALFEDIMLYIGGAILAEKDVSLYPVGTIATYRKKGQKKFIPKLGEMTEIPERVNVKFRPSIQLKTELRKL